MTGWSFCDFIARDESEVVIHSDDAFAPVGFLNFKRMHVEQKELNEVWNNGSTVPDDIINLLNQLSLRVILTQGCESPDKNNWALFSGMTWAS